ncbi:MAG: ArsR family transcriptional regulator [Gammaproteobacteria bacterium]|nr:MAG: ArsR family transcriptional regulator [Gammaproteobacteria bacterium]
MIDKAVTALGALAHPLRLQVFRLLAHHGAGGLPAGDIAARLACPTSTLSAHLARLQTAGLIRSERRGRQIRYAVDAVGTRALLRVLLQDCCGGRPELCGATFVHCPPQECSTVYHVLFLCTGNSARSILAEALLNHLGEGRFCAYSAGSHPKGEVHPQALALLERKGLPTAGLRSKSWDEFTAPGAPTMDFIFTVCDNAAGETCPVWPGRPVTAHWGIPDPAAAEGGPAEQALAFARAYEQLRRRIEAFINLPIAALDELALRERLTAIAREAEAEEAAAR